MKPKSDKKAHAAAKEIQSAKVYHIEKEHGRFYVYLLQIAPVDTLFDVCDTEAEAEAAIEQYKRGEHPTQKQY